MGSTGEPDRKRPHFSSISPTAAATTAKKQPFAPLSEDKKVDTSVLQFQNQKLIQKLEAQRVECIALENKFSQLRVKQQPYDNALAVIDKSLEQLVDSLDSCLIRKKDLFSYGKDLGHQPCIEDGASFPQDNAFLRRLLETGATDSSSANGSSNQMEEDRQTTIDKMKDVLCNLLTVMDGLWSLRSGLHAAALKSLPEEGMINGVCRKELSCDIETEVKNLRLAAGELHLKHKSMEKEMQHHRDADAKNKAQLKRLRGELECAIAEWEGSNSELATLKAERDATKGAFFPILNVGSKSFSIDRGRDKQKDLTDMESALKELVGHASSRLVELKRVHEERIEILKKLIYLQNTLKSVKYISSSQAYVLVTDQLAGAKSDLVHYQALYEKLQVEKDNLAWREKELNARNDLVDVFHRCSAVANSRITELGIDIQKQISDSNIMSSKLEASSREPGRKEVIAKFKALVSTFPEDMGRMQSQLSKYKESAMDVHSLRANVLSLSGILDRKAKELETLSGRSADQIVELNKLHSVVDDLKLTDMELKLILDMYQQESIDTRDVLESRDSEFKAWARVQSLKSSLDEHNLEFRVKSAIEAEAFSQQTLAAAEAEIANLRQKLEVSKREKFRLTDVLKSKHEENEAYLSEIETIDQAYDRMQTKNQHLLQQITERDDYNIKLVLEGVLAKQMWDSLLMEKQTMQWAVEQSNACADYFEVKASRIEDQVRMCLDQIHNLAEDRVQFSVTLENIQKKLLDVKRTCQQLRESLEGSQSKVEKGREFVAELQIELEKERFEKKRLEEELEVMRRKALLLRSQIEGSSVVVKLQQELKEYKDILKCSICLDRPKEVVITKCYHLFCNPCIQKVIDSRHRKCSVCAISFGANDVKPVYI